jgi:hypothetical protein
MPTPQVASSRLHSVLQRVALQPRELQDRAAQLLEGLLEHSFW